MPKKILTIYLHHDDHCFKLRAIEVSPIETTNDDDDAMILSLVAGCEPPFAACLREALNKLTDTDRYHCFATGGLFKKMRESFQSELINVTVDEQPRHIYHDLVLQLFPDAANTPHPDNQPYLLILLGAIDLAVNLFLKQAINSDFDVSVHYCNELPDFSNKPDIIRAAYALPAPRSPEPSPPLSRHIAAWMISEIYSDAYMRNNISRKVLADTVLKPLLLRNEDSLAKPVRDTFYPRFTAPFPDQHKGNIRSQSIFRIKTLTDFDLIAEMSTPENKSQTGR